MDRSCWRLPVCAAGGLVTLLVIALRLTVSATPVTEAVVLASTPAVTGEVTASLESALNADGSVRPGAAAASFDARGWRMTMGPDGSPRFHRETNGSAEARESSLTGNPDDALWDDRFGTRPGANEILAVAISGTELFVGGSFDFIAGERVNRVAHWTGTRWTGLYSGTLDGVTPGDGFGAFVTTIAMSGTDVFLAGRFGFAGGITASYVVRWDGVRFSPLLSGTANGITDPQANTVDSMVITGGKVYVGGFFKAAGGITTSRIAAWDGRRWSALASGGKEGMENGNSLVPTVFALAARGTDIFAGGIFTRAGGTPANNIARWDGSRWLPVLSGTLNGLNSDTSRPVVGLAVVGTDIIAAGSFLTAGGRVATNIARWNGTSWSVLSGGGGEGLNEHVNGIARSGDGVVAVGKFSRAGGIPASGIARWSPAQDISFPGGGLERSAVEVSPATEQQLFSTWSRFSPHPINGPDELVNAVVISGTDVFIGGSFGYAGLARASYVARWNGVAWSPLLSGTANGVNGTVHALVMSGTTLYAAGSFTEAGGARANRVAAWNGVRWSPLLSGTKNGLDDEGSPLPLALAANPNGIFVGGIFTMAGGTVITGVARWTGSAWTGLLSGTRGLDDGYVRALAVSGTHVFAGGFLPAAGGITVNNVARWDGVRWSALMSGSFPGWAHLQIPGLS